MIRALDGSSIDVERVDSTGWALRAWLTSRRLGTSLVMSGDAGVLENSPLPDATVVSEARAGSARLLALTDPSNLQTPTTTFVYQGEYHELYTTKVGVDIPMDAFVAFLRPLDIADSPEGIQAVPKRGSDVAVALQLGVAIVDNVAVLTSYFGTDALEATPTNAGQRVAGGQLWKTDNPVGVLVANETSVTRVEPIVDRNDPAFAALAQSLRITRSAA